MNVLELLISRNIIWSKTEGCLSMEWYHKQFVWQELLISHSSTFPPWMRKPRSQGIQWWRPWWSQGALWPKAQTLRITHLTPGGQPTAHFKSCYFGIRCPQLSSIIFKVQSFSGRYCSIIQNVPMWAGYPKSNCELWGHEDLIANYLQNLIGVINKLSM